MKKITTEKVTIDVRINNKEQLYSDFHYTDDNLNPELSEYIITKAKQAFPIPIQENFVINIHANQADLRVTEIARCIHRHFHDAYDTAKRELQYLMRFTILMLFFGMIALIAQYFAQTYINNFFLTVILNVTAWVFIWEAVDTLFLRRREAHRECLIMRRLAFADVQIVADTKLSAPVYI